jgi:hypothetical protein
LNGSDGSFTYISAYELNSIVETVKDIPNKAEKSDIELLQSILDDKADVSDVELLQNEVSTKSSKAELSESVISINDAIDKNVSQITNKLSEKAEKSVVDSLVSTVKEKAEKSVVDSLVSTVKEKADSKDVNKLLEDLVTLQETVKVLTNSSAIDAINKQIENLYKELEKKLEESDIKNTINTVNTLSKSNSEVNTRLENIEGKLQGKASSTFVQGKLDDITSKIDKLTSTVDKKADKTVVAQKTNKSEHSNLVNKVNRISDDLSEVEINVTKTLNDFEKDINIKADTSYVNSEIQNLDNKIDKIKSEHSNKINADAEAIEILECEFDNHVKDFRNFEKSQSTKNESQDKKIVELQESTNKNTEKLKQPWVRVISTNEYKRLLKAPEGASYNPRYRYQNILYMIVDFSVPKAIYIGDILIAKAQKDGSIGFAYNFPIIF